MERFDSRFSKGPPPVDPDRLEPLLDLPLEISVELGCRSLSMEQLVGLTEGSVIKFYSRVDEPLPLLANGELFGHCDLVPGDSSIHIRVTDLHP